MRFTAACVLATSVVAHRGHHPHEHPHKHHGFFSKIIDFLKGEENEENASCTVPQDVTWNGACFMQELCGTGCEPGHCEWQWKTASQT